MEALRENVTPKEKALELFNFYFHLKFQHFTSVRNSKIIGMPKYAAKECALAAVDTHIYSENNSPFPTMQSWIEDEKFWRDVKQEIEKL